MLDAFGKHPRQPAKSPTDGLERDERHAAVHAGMAKLSPRHREVLALVELAEMSGVEVAAALRIPPGTVWRRLSEARAELARQLKGMEP